LKRVPIPGGGNEPPGSLQSVSQTPPESFLDAAGTPPTLLPNSCCWCPLASRSTRALLTARCYFGSFCFEFGAEWPSSWEPGNPSGSQVIVFFLFFHFAMSDLLAELAGRSGKILKFEEPRCFKSVR